MYHNSYLVLRTEGGWVWTVFVIAITIIVGMRIFVSKTSWTVEERVGQGAAIALLICGLSLGEVFYTFTWAIVMAYAVRAVPSPGTENLACRGMRRKTSWG